MSGAIKKALENLEEIVPAGADGSYYQGQKLAEKRCQEVAAFPGIDTLHKLYAVLRKTWTAETAYPSCQAEWVSIDPSYRLNELQSCIVEKNMYHAKNCYVKIDNTEMKYVSYLR